MMTDYAKLPKTHVFGDMTQCRSVSGVPTFRGGGHSALIFKGQQVHGTYHEHIQP